MRHTITSVGGIARELGIEAGDTLLSIDDRPIKDAIDYEYFCAQAHFTMLLETKDGSLLEAEVEKDPDEHMGLTFENGLMSKQRSCTNHCIFCFVDQLPRDARDTMRFKDDDWRLSFVMGNYVTLTNVKEQELVRIIERRVSPLYISVHTTNPSLRAFMLGRKTASIMPQLQKLAQGNITFHTQVVLCPGINDGQDLEKTFDDLYALFPNTLSLAVVPVGLTGHREGLYPLAAYSAQEAARVVDFVERKQKLCLAEKGTRFIYASDEFYLLAHRATPPYEAYESFCQIENGVGLLAKFERELDDALPELSPCKRRIHIITGQASQAFMERQCDKLRNKGVQVEMCPIKSSYFGGHVTVSGLITGMDIQNGLPDLQSGALLLIPSCMLREGKDVFLDSIQVKELEDTLGYRILVVDVDGYDLVDAINRITAEEKV